MAATANLCTASQSARAPVVGLRLRAGPELPRYPLDGQRAARLLHPRDGRVVTSLLTPIARGNLEETR